MSDDLHPAEIAELEAKAEKYLAEADQARMEAEHARTMALGAAITAERENLNLHSERRKEEQYRAGDYESRVYHFTKEVDDESVARAINTLSTWSRLDPGCGMTIFINSPGGGVAHGMYLYDHIRDLSRAGHHITTVARGVAASMAGILVQSGDTRKMGREAWLLIHEASSLVWGSTGEIKDRAEWLKKLSDRIAGIFYDRSKKTDAPKKLSRETIAKKMERRDWWLDSGDALAYGLVDEVLS